jgi:hypothetical protein
MKLSISGGSTVGHGHGGSVSGANRPTPTHHGASRGGGTSGVGSYGYRSGRGGGRSQNFVRQKRVDKNDMEKKARHVRRLRDIDTRL